MSLQLGDIAPDFEADTTIGRIKFHDWLGNAWGVLFSHPKDYTPVCTTELGYTARLGAEFAKRGVKVLALSVDSVEDHLGWTKDIEQTQDCQLNFPIIADPEMVIAKRYDMIHPKASDRFTVRSVFIIDPNKRIRLTITYPASTGRNFDEILRVIDSLQLTDRYKVATPVNWKAGQDVIIVPAVSNEDAKKLFPGGWKELRPYLRLVPQPKD
jgi:alkyl hydroperoxide reductase subunit AhpC